MSQVKIANWSAYYKYGTFDKIERLRPMICESRFYFASPEELNDPSDCKTIVADHSEQEIVEFLIKANRRFYGDSRSDGYIREGIKKFGPATLLEEMTRGFNKIMGTRFGVFSLARRPNNMALWAKYADGHKGYCLEFSGLRRFANVYEVRYATKLPLALKLEADPEQADFLYTKSSEWSNEEEARILMKPSGYHSLPRSALKGIIFGEHCEPENRDVIQSWVNECDTSISLNKASFNQTRQELEIRVI